MRDKHLRDLLETYKEHEKLFRDVHEQFAKLQVEITPFDMHIDPLELLVSGRIEKCFSDSIESTLKWSEQDLNRAADEFLEAIESTEPVKLPAAESR